MYGNIQGQKQEIAAWVEESCFVIEQFSETGTGRQPGQGSQTLSLYMCR
jgi:hypothetical protein